MKVHAKLFSAMDQAPPGATPPLVKPHSIDDVPILTLTLHSRAYGSDELRQIAIHLEDDVRTIPDVAETFVIGGQPRQMRVTLDPVRMMASGVTAGDVAMALQAGNARLQTGEFAAGDRVYLVRVGAVLTEPVDVGSVVVTTRGGTAIYVRDVARVTEEFGERTDYVSHAERGQCERERRHHERRQAARGQCDGGGAWRARASGGGRAPVCCPPPSGSA